MRGHYVCGKRLNMPRARLALIRKICAREGCPLKGEIHLKCKAHNRAGNPCSGQAMSGQLVCRMHGGQEPNALKAAKQRIAYQQVLSHTSRIVAYDGDYPETPAEGLLREVSWSAQVAIALGEVVEGLRDEHLLSWSAGQGQRINALYDAWERERMNHARLCRVAIDAGIAQAQLDIIETQAGMIVSTLISVLTSPRLGLSSEQIIEGRVIAAEALRLGSGPPIC